MRRAVSVLLLSTLLAPLFPLPLFAQEMGLTTSQASVVSKELLQILSVPTVSQPVTGTVSPIGENVCQTSADRSVWEILTALGTLFAVLVALFAERFWAWLLRPRIKVTFDSHSDRCLRSAVIQLDSIQDHGTIPNVVRQYFRLNVENQGRSSAKNLRAKVEIIDASSKKLVDRFEPSTLRWISGSETIELSQGESEYLNLISVVLDQGSVRYRLRVELFNTSPRGIAWDRYAIPYIFRIVFHGDNLEPFTKYFYFKPDDVTGGQISPTYPIIAIP